MDIYTERFQEILSEAPRWSVPIGLRDLSSPVYVPIKSNLVVCSRDIDNIDNLLSTVLTGALAEYSDRELNFVVLTDTLNLGLPAGLRCHPAVTSVRVSSASKSVQRDKAILGLEEEISERCTILDSCDVRSVADLARSRADYLQQHPSLRALVFAVFLENVDAGKYLTDGRTPQIVLRTQQAINNVLTSDGSLDVYIWMFCKVPPADSFLDLVNRRIAFRVFSKKQSETLLGGGDHRAALLGTAAHGGPATEHHDGYIVDDVNEGFPYRFEQFTAKVADGTAVGSGPEKAAQNVGGEWKRRWEPLFGEGLTVDQLMSLWRETGDTNGNNIFPIGVLEPNESNAKPIYTMNSVVGDFGAQDVIGICGQDPKKNTQTLCSIATAARAAQPGIAIIYVGNTPDLDTGVTLNACADRIVDIDDNDALVCAVNTMSDKYSSGDHALILIDTWQRFMGGGKPNDGTTATMEARRMRTPDGIKNLIRGTRFASINVFIASIHPLRLDQRMLEITDTCIEFGFAHPSLSKYSATKASLLSSETNCGLTEHGFIQLPGIEAQTR